MSIRPQGNFPEEVGGHHSQSPSVSSESDTSFVSSASSIVVTSFIKYHQCQPYHQSIPCHWYHRNYRCHHFIEYHQLISIVSIVSGRFTQILFRSRSFPQHSVIRCHEYHHLYHPCHYSFINVILVIILVTWVPPESLVSVPSV